MPISEYFGGKGRKVMKSMKEQYGPEKGEQVFYATANKEGQKPTEDEKAKNIIPEDVAKTFAGKARSSEIGEWGFSVAAQGPVVYVRDRKGRLAARLIVNSDGSTTVKGEPGGSMSRNILTSISRAEDVLPVPVEVDDEFNEKDHPRAATGEFSSSGAKKLPTSQATLSANRTKARAAKEKSKQHQAAAHSMSHAYSPEEEDKLKRLFGKDALPLPIAIKKVKLAAHNAGLTEAQDLTPVKADGKDFSKSDEDAYFKRRKEIEADLNKKNPNDDTNRLRAHEQALRERGEKVTPYRVAAGDGRDPKAWLLVEKMKRLIPKMKQAAASGGDMMRIYETAKELKSDIGEFNDEYAYDTAKSLLDDVNQASAKTHDSSPEATLTEARKAEVAQDHARALDAYRQAATGFRKVGDSRNEQIARDGIAACQRQAVGGCSDEYTHPSHGKVQAFDSAERALESAVERTRSGENVALEESGTVVAPCEDTVGSWRGNDYKVNGVTLGFIEHTPGNMWVGIAKGGRVSPTAFVKQRTAEKWVEEEAAAGRAKDALPLPVKVVR